MKGQKGCEQAHMGVFKPLPLFVWAEATAARLGRWRDLAHQRNQLAAMSDDALKDLGLSRADIACETERPFWDDPMRR
jgi:uncharacterized protein YjiS (DUF1127 family)